MSTWIPAHLQNGQSQLRQGRSFNVRSYAARKERTSLDRVRHSSYSITASSAFLMLTSSRSNLQRSFMTLDSWVSKLVRSSPDCSSFLRVRPSLVIGTRKAAYHFPFAA